jgi:Raf kinase inhibitor-like YbhB/YbcL family protein
MKIGSKAFEHNNSIPSKYTCEGEDINPPLHFSDVPDKAKSLVLIVDDPDAPAKTWVHWILWNIPPDTSEIKEGSTPKSLEGITDFGRPGWGGPCPPSGSHRYFFKLYALDKELELPPTSKKSDLENEMAGHIIGSAELIGLYKRVQ